MAVRTRSNIPNPNQCLNDIADHLAEITRTLQQLLTVTTAKKESENK